MKSIIIFASGSGSNAENIIKYFHNNNLAKVVLVLTNKKDAKVIDRCNDLNVSSLYFNKHAFKQGVVLNILKQYNPDIIVLAGFLLKIPETIVKAFPNRIINIHPALLPKYGGKGMYGMHVHNAVVENKETVSGITIHYVNEHYDEGNIIFQATTSVEDNDTPERVAEKIHDLEYQYFPITIAKLLED